MATRRTQVYFFTDEETTHGAEQFRAVLDGKLHEQKFRVVNVLDGKAGVDQTRGGIRARRAGMHAGPTS